ncbi:methyl-accepting chemotaxis protein [Marinomonas pollencensis]|uniref:Methyl-accepting chemotaxis protein n=1 Tax=Marinomonas pollencensis TaxID=491954 RepID=A0A3E0DV37_9GAMM|nr:methyl-accepting chemotaxis protein [Marinomonas pollencensis]REG86725.1 methyl-accepting chemotaxis protein [Marinomonas pollencensis]
MKSIQLKIATFSGLSTLCAIFFLSVFSFLSNKQLHENVQENTGRLVNDLFEKQLEGRLDNSAQHISNLMQQSFVLSESMANTFRSLKETADSQANYSNLRDGINAVLKNTIIEQPDLLGVYTGWEPNALDGRDAEYRGKTATGNDRNGRLVPYWTNSKDGGGVVELMEGYDDTQSNVSAEAYYLCPKQTQRACVLDPYSYPVNGVDTMMTSIIHPIMVKGQFMGISGLDISLKSFDTISSELSNELYHGQSQVMIISRNGTIVSDSNGEYSGKKLSAAFNNRADSLLATMTQKKFQLLSSANEGYFEAVSSIKVGKGVENWALWVRVPKDVVMADFLALNKATNEKQFTQTVWFVAAGLLITLLSIVIIWWLSGKISKPIKKLTQFMSLVAKGDFRQRIDHQSADEVGQLSKACNQFLDQIQPLLKQVVDSSNQITSFASQSAAISAETLQGASQQQEDVIQLASALTELSATAQNVADNTITAAQSTQEMKSIAGQGQEVLNESNGAMQALSQNVKYSSDVINRVSRDSQEIQTVMDVIREIAEQTNLLALNAAIEAARAGEQGRGFAVVADEVRSLAKRTQESTSAIQDQIERLQASALEAVEAMKQGSEKAEESESKTLDANQKLKEILDNIDELNDLIIQVSSAAEQQRSVTDSISVNVNNITAVASQTASGATQSNETSQQLESYSGRMKELVSKFVL